MYKNYGCDRRTRYWHSTKMIIVVNLHSILKRINVTYYNLSTFIIWEQIIENCIEIQFNKQWDVVSNIGRQSNGHQDYQS